MSELFNASTLQVIITAVSSVACALLTLFGIYLQIQNNAMRKDIEKLREQMALLQKAQNKTHIVELGDVVDGIFGFSQVRDENGTLINQYKFYVSQTINLRLEGEYKHFHAIISGEKLDGDGICEVIATLDGEVDNRWYVGRYSIDIPINVNISDVQTMTIRVVSSSKYPCNGSIIFSDTEIK